MNSILSKYEIGSRSAAFVMSTDAGAIPAALQSVREDRRPAINADLFSWYGHTFPGHCFDLCCFNNKDAQQAAPMIWMYEPARQDKLMLLGVDCHTGRVPLLGRDVDVDHWIMLGSQQERPGFVRVHYAQQLPWRAAQIMPKYVMGEYQYGKKPNGDFILPGQGPLQIERGVMQLQ